MSDERFWKKVDKSAGPDGCWLWTGATHTNGYGDVYREGRHHAAHRWSYRLATGEHALTHLDVCHRCDVRNCVNPAHLFVGTRTDNMRDCAAKGRNAMQKHPERSSLRRIKHRALGEQQGSSKLTAEQVDEIRRLAAEGLSSSTVARRFGLSAGHVRKLVSGIAWKHTVRAALAPAETKGEE